MKLLNIPMHILKLFLLSLIFYGLITPLSFILKVFKKDILNLKKNRDKTYWIKKNKKKFSMKEQY